MQNQESKKNDRNGEEPVKKNKKNGGEKATDEIEPSASGAVELELDPVEQLKLLLRQKEKEVAEIRDQLLRNMAETENFKRRILKEKSDAALYANEKLIRQLIPVYENFERALSAPDANLQSLKQGVDMIFKQFAAFMEKENVKPIAALGQKFDPSIHEALSQAESADHEENTVIQEFSKGFYLNDRVLQPARVVISKKPSVQKPENEADKDSADTLSSEKSKSIHK